MKSQTFVGGLTERGRTLQLEQHCRHCQGKFDWRLVKRVHYSLPRFVGSLPSILLDHMSKLDYKLALLILLT